MKILIVKTSSLGDIVQAFPVLSYLRKRFPLAQIDWIVEAPFVEILRAHPLLNHVWTIESKKWRKAPLRHLASIRKFRSKLREVSYDLVLDLQGNIKSGVILAQTRSKTKVGYGWKSVAEWPNTLFTNKKMNPPKGKNIREDYLALVQNYFNDSTPFASEPIELQLTETQQAQVDAILSDAVMVCPGAAWPNKQLAFEQLLTLLKELDKEPYLFAWGTENEHLIATQLADHFSDSSVLERYALPVLQHIMAKCSLVIAMDSLPLHLCATTTTPTISFFGPSSAIKYGPLGEGHRIIQGKCPYGVTFEKRCPKLRTCKTGACLKDLQKF